MLAAIARIPTAAATMITIVLTTSACCSSTRSRAGGGLRDVKNHMRLGQWILA